MGATCIKNNDQVYQRFTDFIEISERSFLRSYPYNLRRSHDELLLLASDHIWIFLAHNLENTVKKFIVRVITIRATPSDTFIFSCNKEKEL